MGNKVPYAGSWVRNGIQRALARTCFAGRSRLQTTCSPCASATLYWPTVVLHVGCAILAVPPARTKTPVTAVCPIASNTFGGGRTAEVTTQPPQYNMLAL